MTAKQALTCLTAGAILLGARGPAAAALVYPKAPEGGQPMVAAFASQTLQKDPGFLGGFRFEQLQIAAPYRQYGVGLTNLAAGRLLSAAACNGGWLYLLLHQTNAVGAADVLADETTGKALRATGLYQANFSQETLQALRAAKRLPQLKHQDYEVRRLDIPALHFVALWLHGKSDDFILPLSSGFGRWTAYRPYSESELLQLLKPEAKSKLRQPPGFGSRPS